MAMPCSSAAAITSSSRIEPPGWITAVAPASAAASRPSANGKKASEATTEPLVSGSARPAASRGLRRLAGGDARGIDAAHLAGADADRGAVLGIDDGVRLHVLGDPEGEHQVGQLGCGRRALGHDLQRPCRRPRHCRASAPGSRRRPCAPSSPAARGSGRPPVEQQAQVLLRGDDRDRPPSSASGAMITSVKISTISSRGLGVERPVERDDAAEGRDRVAAQRLVVGLEQGRAFGDAAGIGVLDDGDGGGSAGSNSATQLEGGVGVVDVVVGELLALHLPRRGDARPLLGRAIEGGRLVRVLAVAQRLRQACRRRRARSALVSPSARRTSWRSRRRRPRCGRRPWPPAAGAVSASVAPPCRVELGQHRGVVGAGRRRPRRRRGSWPRRGSSPGRRCRCSRCSRRKSRPPRRVASNG